MTLTDPVDLARPDGRWARVLRAAAGGHPLKLTDINRAVRRRGEGHTHQGEKKKTSVTVRQLVAHRLLARTKAGFITTVAGLNALESCRAAQATAG